MFLSHSRERTGDMELSSLSAARSPPVFPGGPAPALDFLLPLLGLPDAATQQELVSLLNALE